jgi:hypothetical protein
MSVRARNAIHWVTDPRVTAAPAVGTWAALPAAGGLSVAAIQTVSAAPASTVAVTALATVRRSWRRGRPPISSVMRR